MFEPEAAYMFDFLPGQHTVLDTGTLVGRVMAEERQGLVGTGEGYS